MTRTDRAPLAVAVLAAAVVAMALVTTSVAGADTTTTATSTTSTSTPSTTSTSTTSTTGPSSTTTSSTAPTTTSALDAQAIQEPTPITAAESAATSFIAAGTPLAGSPGIEIELNNVTDLQLEVADPSPELSTAVQQFFQQGGSTAYLWLTPDEQADTLVAAAGQLATSGSSAGLFVIPTIGSFDGQDYLGVAAALAALADSQLGFALLDPPSSVIAAVTAAWPDVRPLIDLSTQLRSAIAEPSSAALFATPLTDIDSGDTVPTGPVMAGMIASQDERAGTWSPAAGTRAVAIGLTSPLSFTNSQMSTLDGSANVFRNLPNYGTVMWGSRTLDSNRPDDMYISVIRTAGWLQRSITESLGWVQFAPDDQKTQNMVEQPVSAFVASLWEQGAFIGNTASEAFQVAVGPGATNAPNDGSDIALRVDVALVYPAEFRTIDMSIPTASG